MLGTVLVLALAGSVATVSAQAEPHGFAAHLRDAIALNRERRPYYETRTAGASRALSNRLINQERIALLAAEAFDERARPFEAQGIPVVSGSFVSMRLAPDPATPWPGARVADSQAQEAVRGILRTLSGEIHAALEHDDFRRAGEVCASALTQIEALETRTGSHFAMSRHVVDSLGYTALDAIECAKRTGGATSALSRYLVGIQTIALGTAVNTDRQAQVLQARGVGILLNDLPHIPFLERWRELAATP